MRCILVVSRHGNPHLAWKQCLDIVREVSCRPQLLQSARVSLHPSNPIISRIRRSHACRLKRLDLDNRLNEAATCECRDVDAFPG